jgi:hypothetical protein
MKKPRAGGSGAAPNSLHGNGGGWGDEPPAWMDVRFWHKADILNALTNVRFLG